MNNYHQKTIVVLLLIAAFLYALRLGMEPGTGDGFARQNRLIADLMLPDLVFTVPGGDHDWETWKKLWKQVLDHIEAKMAEQKSR